MVGPFFSCPWIQNLGVAKVVDIAGCNERGMSNSHRFDQTIPESLRLAFDFTAVFKLGPDQGRFRIPIHDQGRKFPEEIGEFLANLFASHERGTRLCTLLNFSNDNNRNQPFG